MRGIVGLVLAPHFSRASVGEYQAAAAGRPPPSTAWRRPPSTAGTSSPATWPSWPTPPGSRWPGSPSAPRCSSPRTRSPSGRSSTIPYPDQLRASADAVAQAVGLAPWAGWAIAWQSAGRTADPWRGPDILTVLDDLAASGRADGVLVVPQGFVSDHLEVVYDLDLEARRRAEGLGLAFARTRVLNDDPTVMAALADRVRAAASVTESRRRRRRGGRDHRARRRPASWPSRGHRVVVLDPGTVGGKLRSTEFDGGTLDDAADAFLARVPEGVALCRDLGLEGTLVSPAERRAHVWSQGALRRLPQGQVLGVPTDLDELAESGLLSPAGLAGARRDLDEPLVAPQDDPAIGARSSAPAWATRWPIGSSTRWSAASTPAPPTLLSLAATVPQLDAAVRSGAASLIEACRAQRAAATDPTAPVFFAPRGGMGAITDALVADLRRPRRRAAAPPRPARSNARPRAGRSSTTDGRGGGRRRGRGGGRRRRRRLAPAPARGPSRHPAGRHPLRVGGAGEPGGRARRPSTASSTAAASSSRGSRAAPSPRARGPRPSGPTSTATARCGCGPRWAATATPRRSISTTTRSWPPSWPTWPTPWPCAARSGRRGSPAGRRRSRSTAPVTSPASTPSTPTSPASTPRVVVAGAALRGLGVPACIRQATTAAARLER